MESRIKTEIRRAYERIRELGHMEKVNQNEEKEKSYYIPHHAVFRDSSATTKLGVVRDQFREKPK